MHNDIFEFDECIGLFYDHATGRFVDEDGDTVWSIFELITPNDLLLFRHYQDYMVVPHRTQKGVGVELFYSIENCQACHYCANYNDCYGND